MRILIPIDLSIPSGAAIEAVSQLKTSGSSSVVLLNVVPPIDSLLPFAINDNTIGKEQEIVAERAVWLKEIVEDLREKRPDLKIDYRIRFGHAKEVIPREAQKDRADLIVMASRGHRGVQRILLGSVSHAVLEHSSCPILLVKGEEGTRVEFRKVLVTFDGSVYSRDTIEWLAKAGLPNGTQVRVLMVIPEFHDFREKELSIHQVTVLKKQWSKIRERSFQMMEEVALSLGQTVGNQNLSIDAVPGDPREKIIESANEFGADLIVMGSHGRSGLERMLIGSVSLHVAFSASCPVLVVKRLNAMNAEPDEYGEEEESESAKQRRRPPAEERPPFTMM